MIKCKEAHNLDDKMLLLQINFVARKFSLFAETLYVVNIKVLVHFKEYPKKRERVPVLEVVGRGIFYAFIDEFHQVSFYRYLCQCVWLCVKDLIDISFVIIYLV